MGNESTDKEDRERFQLLVESVNSSMDESLKAGFVVDAVWNRYFEIERLRLLKEICNTLHAIEGRLLMCQQ